MVGVERQARSAAGGACGGRAIALGLLALALCGAPGCATPDPPPKNENALDRFNRGSDDFNDWMLQHVLKPVAKGYNFVVPKLAQTAVENVIVNLQRPRDIVNSLLQLKFERAGRHLAHFILNTGWGFGGILYVSHRALDDDSPETFNETLGHWGVPPGPFLILPLVVPPFIDTSPRKLVGTAVDTVLNPLFWIPGTSGTIVSASATAVGGLNTLATLMPSPFASEAEWAAFEELITERVSYPERKELFYDNQRLDVED